MYFVEFVFQPVIKWDHFATRDQFHGFSISVSVFIVTLILTPFEEGHSGKVSKSIARFEVLQTLPARPSDTKCH